MTGPPRIEIGSLVFDNLSWDRALDRLEELALSRRGGYAVTPNVDHVVLAENDGYFRRINLEADLSLPDGMPLVWVSRLLGTPLKEKISGSDFLPRFAPRAAARGLKIFLLGGRPGAAQKSALLLRGRFPELKVAGVLCPPWGFERDERTNREAVEAVRASGADIVFVGLGTPKQEKWYYENRAGYEPAFSFPLGAGFDFLSGQVRRAPSWIARAGLEWTWRLAREPRRMFARYIVRDSRFLPIVLRQLRGRRPSREARGPDGG